MAVCLEEGSRDNDHRQGPPSLGMSAGARSLSWATTMENISGLFSKLEELATNIWASSIAFFHCLHRKTGSSQWIQGYLPGTWHMTGVSHKSPHEPPTVWEGGRPSSFYWWGNAGSARLHSLPALSHCGVAEPGLEAASKTSQPLLFSVSYTLSFPNSIFWSILSFFF